MPLISADKREDFVLDISKSRIDLAKGRYQTRGRQVVILARLDFGGAPHRNPDGEKVGSPHLHLYREGFADKWAVPIPRDKFPDPTNRRQMLDDFMKYCNVVKSPTFVRDLLL